MLILSRVISSKISYFEDINDSLLEENSVWICRDSVYLTINDEIYDITYKRKKKI